MAKLTIVEETGYTDVWNNFYDHVITTAKGSKRFQDPEFRIHYDQQLALYGARDPDVDGYIILFSNKESLTEFVLRWS